MILTHFKQAWQLLKQNKLFSTIYIAGTAIAIASTTIFAIIYYVKLAPVYPEYNRQRMSVVRAVEIAYNGGSASGAVSGASIRQYLSKMPNADVVSAYRNY
ncbi:MAG: ABC transporter permease, partial [Muribaculaceae bacterium]|nr:ABC transporter permease [Muribaculaceae bacterium]